VVEVVDVPLRLQYVVEVVDVPLRLHYVVEVVDVPLRLHHVCFRWKGFFEGRLQRQVPLDRWTRTENKNTSLVDILLTHIMYTVF